MKNTHLYRPEISETLHTCFIYCANEKSQKIISYSVNMVSLSPHKLTSFFSDPKGDNLSFSAIRRPFLSWNVDREAVDSNGLLLVYRLLWLFKVLNEHSHLDDKNLPYSRYENEQKLLCLENCLYLYGCSGFLNCNWWKVSFDN